MVEVAAVTDGEGAPYELTAAQAGMTFTNEGAVEKAAILLPAAAVGLWYEFVVLEAVGLMVYCDGALIVFYPEQSGDAIESVDLYSSIKIACLDGINWVAYSGTGIWQIGVAPVAGITKLATVEGIDLELTTKQDLYTVPTGKICIPTLVIIRNASVTPDDINFKFGFNAGSDDVGLSNTLNLLTSALSAIQIAPATGSLTEQLQFYRKLGAAAEVLGCIMASANSVPCTVDIDVFGYLIDA
jgi:hypothetical protein